MAQKRGIEIGRSSKYKPVFYRLIEKTAERNKFAPFPEEHYKKMFDFSSSDFKVEMRTAKNMAEGQEIIASIMVFFNRVAYYLHSASDLKESGPLNASEYLQWLQIKEAKENGCQRYDFWGIDEKKWPGVTFFKKGFSGREQVYPAGFDFVFNKFWYGIYKTAKLCKKLLKKF